MKIIHAKPVAFRDGFFIECEKQGMSLPAFIEGIARGRIKEAGNGNIWVKVCLVGEREWIIDAWPGCE